MFWKKIIQDSKKLKYPKWKLFFDVLTLIGLIFIIAKLVMFIIIKITGNEINFLTGSVFYTFVPLFLMIIGAIGAEILRKSINNSLLCTLHKLTSVCKSIPNIINICLREQIQSIEIYLYELSNFKKL